MGNVYEALRRAEAGRFEREADANDSVEVLQDPGQIRWEGAIFERVSSIEQQLAALEESLGKRVPEIEERLLHLLEGRFAGLGVEIHQEMSLFASQLASEADRSRGDHRRVLLALAAVGLLVLLF